MVSAQEQPEEHRGAKYNPVKPHVWVYDPHQLHSGLDLPEVSMHLVRQDELNERARKLFGREYDSPFLATKSGLETPIAIFVGGQLRPFIPEIKIGPYDTSERFERFEYHQFRQRLFGDKPIPEIAQGRGFEIWALNRYPTPEKKVYRQFGDDSSVIFDPSADPDTLREPVQKIYDELVDYRHDLSVIKPAVLGWYIRDGQFRISSRPYRTKGQKQIAIATTLPIELIAD